MAGLGRGGNDRGDDGARDPDDLTKRLIWAFLAVIAGGGGAFSYQTLNPPRPDPFTGTMGREMRAELDRDISDLRSEIKAVHAQLQQHLVRGEAGFYRIENLEREVRQLKGQP